MNAHNVLKFFKPTCAPLAGETPHNRIQLRPETHVKQAIRLIQNQHFNCATQGRDQSRRPAEWHASRTGRFGERFSREEEAATSHRGRRQRLVCQLSKAPAHYWLLPAHPCSQVR